LKITNSNAISEDALKKLYETKEGFLDSVKLEDMSGLLSLLKNKNKIRGRK
jgi:hypothetical protein